MKKTVQLLTALLLTVCWLPQAKAQVGNAGFQCSYIPLDTASLPPDTSSTPPYGAQVQFNKSYAFGGEYTPQGRIRFLIIYAGFIGDPGSGYHTNDEMTIPCKKVI